MVESLIGALLGGLLRLAPELLKLFDRKAERDHEFRMQGLELEIARQQLAAGLRLAEATLDLAALQTVGTALQGQASMARAGGRLVAAVSALVRPLITYWIVGLFSLHKGAVMLAAHQQGAGWQQVFITTWTEQDWGLLSLVLSFWFLGRVWERASPPRYSHG